MTRCSTCDEWYDDNSERAKVHKHPEPQSGKAHASWIASRLTYERWIVETDDGRRWAEASEFGSVVCPGCGNGIDPNVCWCGDFYSQHNAYSGHNFVPMGCDCGRDKGGASCA